MINVKQKSYIHSQNPLHNINSIHSSQPPKSTTQKKQRNSN